MNLTDRALMVNLSISQWSAAKSDKKINREVADSHGSDESMGNYRKALIARESIQTVTKLTGSIRSEHYRLTLPWRDSGDRVLSSVGYFAYVEKMRAFERDWNRAVSEFCANYAGYVADARTKLNGLFDAADYPSEAEIRGKFSFKLEINPLPAVDDFRVQLGSEEIARIQQEFQSNAKTQIDRAMGDVWNRLQDVVSKMAERLKAYKVRPDGKVENPFRDTLVTNITDLLDIVPSLNLTGDANIETFAREIRESLTVYSPEQLREAEYRREDVANRADEILNKMSAFIA